LLVGEKETGFLLWKCRGDSLARPYCGKHKRNPVSGLGIKKRGFCCGNVGAIRLLAPTVVSIKETRFLDLVMPANANQGVVKIWH
jgi:hypothetical protein